MRPLLVLITAASLFAVPEPVPVFPLPSERLTSSFGEYRNDHFHNGIDLGGDRLPINPMYPGEIVFYYDDVEDPTRMITGTGNTVVMEHTNKVRTYYYHITSGSIQKKIARLMTNDVLALTGNTGRSGGAHLHLTVEDMEQNKSVNPLTLLPPIKDTVRPRIDGLFIKTDLKLQPLRNNYLIKNSGEMKYFLKAYDKTENGYQTGLRRVRMYIDGELVRDYDFSFLVKKKQEYCVAPGYPFDEVYGVDPYFYRGGTFIPTKYKHTFSAEVEDFFSNTTSYSATVVFRK